jgi:hypothetical protein
MASGSSHMNGTNYRMVLFWWAFTLLFVAYSCRVGYELVRPLLWLACPLSIVFIVGGGIWFYLRWRDRDGY